MSSWRSHPLICFQPNTAQSPEWNRGAYLAEALAHCGECHTPRDLAVALNNRKKFAGAIAARWHAFNNTSDRGSGIGAWCDRRSPTILTSRPWSSICAAFRRLHHRSPERSRRRRRRLPSKAAKRRTRSASGSSKGRASVATAGLVSARSRLTPPLPTRARRQRSARDQRRADRDLRHQAAHAAGRRLHAGVRRDLLRHGNRRRRELRNEALSRRAIKNLRQGRRRLARSNVLLMRPSSNFSNSD